MHSPMFHALLNIIILLLFSSACCNDDEKNIGDGKKTKIILRSRYQMNFGLQLGFFHIFSCDGRLFDCYCLGVELGVR